MGKDLLGRKLDRGQPHDHQHLGDGIYGLVGPLVCVQNLGRSHSASLPLVLEHFGEGKDVLYT